MKVEFPIEVLNKHEFTSGEWRIFCSLFILVKRKNRKSMPIQFIADYSGFGIAQTTRYLNYLYKKGIITKTRKNAGMHFTYDINV